MISVLKSTGFQSVLFVQVMLGSTDKKFYIGSDNRVFKTLVNSGENGKLILEAVLRTVFGEVVDSHKSQNSQKRQKYQYE